MREETNQNYNERIITIGNTEYMVIAKPKEGVKQKVFDITKGLLLNSVSSFMEELSTEEIIKNDSLKGCGSGGQKE